LKFNSYIHLEIKWSFKVQAKILCEKRLSELQGRSHISIGDSFDEAHPNDLSFRAVMNSPFSRKFLYGFLESRSPPQHDLVRHLKVNIIVNVKKCL
jgi:hypothetical protein